MEVSASQPLSRPPRRIGAALGLFFLAPLVGEFLLGNLPITMLPALLLLAPLYGGGALLIRETARRFDLTWPGMLVLGLAFGVIEEVFVTQSLFNPNYLGLRLLDYGYIPALGMGAWWTVFVLALHTIWSTAVPIALMETLTPAQRRAPWLGRIGLVVTAVVFVLGCAALLAMELKKGFMASPRQFAASAVAVVALIFVAFRVGGGRRTSPPEKAKPVPKPLGVGIGSFVLGAVFFALVKAAAWLPAWADVVAILLLLAGAAALVLAWSRRTDWAERHRLALAAGFLLTYGWYGFVQKPSAGNVSAQVDLIGNVLFASGALVLLAVAVRLVCR
jgi:hypothetical protein